MSIQKIPKIIQTNYGLASVYEEFMELNCKLYGSLREKIIKHENRHKSDRHYTKEDFKNDFQSENSYFLESLKFSVMNPECLVGFFPFMYSYYAKQFTFNFAALFPFLYLGLIFTAFFSLLFKIYFYKAFIGWIVVFIIIQFILLLYTHIYVKRQKNFEYKEVLV
jgi:hypothetical protein